MKPTTKIIKDKIILLTIWILSLLGIVPLLIILLQISKQTIVAFKDGFSNKILIASIGTLILITIATILAVPIGICVGIFLSEKDNRLSRLLQTLTNVIQGLPSIVVGILAYLWIVIPMNGFSALSGAVALGLMMLPIVIKNTEEAVKRVPQDLKEAAYSLGASYSTTLWKVVLPTAMGGIISGILLGISRIAGETAPLLFTAFGSPYLTLNPLHPTDALPLLIFNYAMSPYPEWHKISWQASFVLIGLILTINIIITVVTKHGRNN